MDVLSPSPPPLSLPCRSRQSHAATPVLGSLCLDFAVGAVYVLILLCESLEVEFNVHQYIQQNFSCVWVWDGCDGAWVNVVMGRVQSQFNHGVHADVTQFMFT